MEEEKIVYAPEFTDLQFIKEVSNFPCLYHHMDRDYRNVEKEECWLHIGQSLDCPDIDLLKKKWDVLKKKYIRRRLGVRYKDWPLYESFDEIFGKFIQKKSKRKTSDKSTKKRGLELLEKLSQLSSHEAKVILDQMEELITLKSSMGRAHEGSSSSSS